MVSSTEMKYFQSLGLYLSKSVCSSKLCISALHSAIKHPLVLLLDALATLLPSILAVCSDGKVSLLDSEIFGNTGFHS